MPNRTFISWSDNPYAPQISYELYFIEKVSFAGPFIGAIFYGIVVVLFFECMKTLLNLVDPTRGRIKWGLVAHTTVMFSFVTLFTVITNIPPDYIENREYPGNKEYPPGPFGYGLSCYADPLGLFISSTFYLNQWLADGILLYRCYIIYGARWWAVAFPGLMYLATLAMGILIIYETCRLQFNLDVYVASHFAVPYYSIALSLNIILTLMIVIRLARHGKNLRVAMGPLSRPDRLYRTIITILIESSALYAISFIAYIGPWGSKESVGDAIFPLLSQAQVISPFLIILRVANQTALTTDTIATGNIKIDPLHFMSHGGSNGQDAPSEGYPVTGIHTSEESSGERDVRVETTFDEVRLSQGSSDPQRVT